MFEFFRGSNDFIVQKVYLLRLMPVCVGLIMIAAYLCALIKVDWLAACIELRVVGAVWYWLFFPPALA